MRCNLGLMFLAVGIPSFMCSAYAVDSEPITNGRHIEQKELTELGQAVDNVDLYRDNFYRYEAQVKHLTETAVAMEGGTVEMLLTVRRVTPGEVLCEPSDAGRTRMILKHAAPPFFGNLGTVCYRAQPSADYWNMLAKPVGLRIGDEITLEMAKEVLKRDVLRVSGRVESIPMRIDGAFRPRVAAVVVDWTVVEVIEYADEEEVRY